MVLRGIELLKGFERASCFSVGPIVHPGHVHRSQHIGTDNDARHLTAWNRNFSAVQSHGNLIRLNKIGLDQKTRGIQFDRRSLVFATSSYALRARSRVQPYEYQHDQNSQREKRFENGESHLGKLCGTGRRHGSLKVGNSIRDGLAFDLKLDHGVK